MKINRVTALARVNSLTRMEKLIAWAIAWDFSYDEIAQITRTTYRNVKHHTFHARKKLGCDHNAGIAMVLIMAEGIREAELFRYPGVPISPMPPQELEQETA